MRSILRLESKSLLLRTRWKSSKLRNFFFGSLDTSLRILLMISFLSFLAIAVSMLPFFAMAS